CPSAESVGARMKIVYVTVSFPFGAGEAFLIPELQELIKQGHDVLITPLWPGRSIIHSDAKELIGYTRRAPLESFGVLRDAAIEFSRHCRMAARMIRRLITVRNLRMLTVNAA